MGPREYAVREKDDAAHQIGRYEGKRDAMEDMARHLDPTRYCQDCGQDPAPTGGKPGRSTNRSASRGRTEWPPSGNSTPTSPSRLTRPVRNLAKQ
jgi:hypothetical protein